METAHSSAQSLLRLINDILDFSRIEAGKLTLQDEVFSPRQVAEEAARMLAGPAQQKGLALQLFVEDDVPQEVRGDPARLTQILTNLLSNAVKFTDSGRVILHIQMQDNSRDPVHLAFDVIDTGIGISEEAQDRIFDSFSQADGSTTRKYGGIGLGLAICRQLASLMGGEISLETLEGKGSTFRVRLPFQSVFRTKPKAQPTQSPLTGTKVLVVTEDTTDLVALSSLLKVWEIDFTGTSGGEALNELRKGVASQTPYLLALVDLGSLETGLKFVEQVHADKTVPDLPCLICKKVGERVQKGDYGRAVFASLEKPVRQSALFDALVHSLGHPLAVKPVEAGLESTQSRFQGKRILVAEDNKTNQAVARGMLQSLGCEVDVVGNGWQAVGSVSGSTYDLILMDCQMPNLDGYEATSRIRQKEMEKSTSKPFSHLPIVALTANAMQGDREKCLQAGMDDYLSKPFTLEQLTAVLDRWLDNGVIQEPGDTSLSVQEQGPYLESPPYRVSPD